MKIAKLQAAPLHRKNPLRDAENKINGKAVRLGWCVLAIIVFGAVLAIRIRLLGIPLERDEGEYAYSGQLMLQGIPPYKLAYNMKFPGTYAAYALIMAIFGQTIIGIHLGLLLVNAATIALVFLLGRRLMNSTAGIAAAMSYAVLSVSPSVLGLAAHATNFAMVAVLGGMLLILNLAESERPFQRIFTSGMLFGIGALMKQPALLFILFGAIHLVWNDVHQRLVLRNILLRNVTFWIAAIVPFGVTCLILSYAGVLDKFWFWTIKYASQYGTLVPLTQVPQIFFQSATEVAEIAWALWFLAGIGAVAGFWDHRTRGSTLFLISFLFFSALALCPGFHFRPHYFILVLPAVSLLTGAAISKLCNFVAGWMTPIRFVPVLLFAVVLSVPILSDKKVFFEVTPNQACGIIYSNNPFLESVRIAAYVRDHTTPDETIAVLGSEPEIYFYSHRHSATGYIYTYGLMEPQKYERQMQQDMIRDIENARPKYLISVAVPYSWLPRPDSDQAIFTWAKDYTAQNYTVAGLVNMIGPDRTDYYFGSVPESVQQLGKYILIYERKS